MVIIRTGGLEALRAWIIEQRQTSYETVTIDNVQYYVYGNGTVTSTTGRVLVRTGGMAALREYVTVYVRRTFVEVEGVRYEVHGTGGKVTDPSGAVVVETGGVNGLRAWLLASRFQTVNAGGEQYRLYQNGTVHRSDGTFLLDGGVSALQSYLQTANAPTHQVVNANGVAYHLHNNGTTTTPAGVVVVASGGMAALRTYIEAASRPEYQTITSGANTYRLYPDNRVEDEAGNVLTTGGVDGLTAYLTEQANAPAAGLALFDWRSKSKSWSKRARAKAEKAKSSPAFQGAADKVKPFVLVEVQENATFLKEERETKE